MAERLAVDITVKRETRLFGKKWDDTVPVVGAKITRVIFNKVVGGPVGRGDAIITDAVLPDVVVHCWLDLGSNLTYTLQIWVED